jgi:uncharacterized protein YjbI with pentapeptide repeats
MTLRDWLPILIALLIPLVIFLGTRSITLQQADLEERRAQDEQELAEQRAQDEALQAYLDEMGQLMLNTDLLDPPDFSTNDNPSRTLARARTINVLAGLDPSRKERVFRFLYEARLINSDPPTYPNPPSEATQQGQLDTPVIHLDGANLQEVNLSGLRLDEVHVDGADLRGADLSHSVLHGAWLNEANLSEANLSNAGLSGARFIRTILRNANLSDAYADAAQFNLANLTNADLAGADFYGDLLEVRNPENFPPPKGALFTVANLRDADLSGTDLKHADFNGANLSGADLSRADLSGANLKNANVTEEQLEQAESLEGATMPNGQKYEDWLKSKN